MVVPLYVSYSDVQIMKIDDSLDLTFSFGLNYPEFPDSCFRLKFALFKNIPDMFINGTNIFFWKYSFLALYVLSTLHQSRILKAEMSFLRYDEMIQDAQAKNLAGLG